MEHPAEQLKIRELKELLRYYDIDSSSYFEKAELVNLVKEHNLDVHKWQQQQKEHQNGGQSQNTRTTSQPHYANTNNTQEVDNKFAKMSYYEILGLDPKCTQAQIKKAYYTRARECHPDKNPDNPEAEAMFKAVSEAYSILIDEDKRRAYDKFGKEGLTGEAIFNPSVLFRMMFGGDFFEDTFGELTFIGAMNEEPVDPPKLALNEKQKEKLIHKLLIKLEPHIHGGLDNFKVVATFDIEQKLEAPGGPALLIYIGKIYIEKAKQYQGRYLGIEGFFSNIAEKGNFAGQVISALSLVIKISKEHSKLEELGEADEEAQKRIASLGLNIIWTIGKIEIDRTVSSVCEAVLTDTNVPPALRKARANALRALGEMYVEAGEKLSATKNTDDAPFDVTDFFKPTRENTESEIDTESNK